MLGIQDNSFFGVILTPHAISGITFTPKKSFLNSFFELK